MCQPRMRSLGGRGGPSERASGSTWGVDGSTIPARGDRKRDPPRERTAAASALSVGGGQVDLAARARDASDDTPAGAPGQSPSRLPKKGCGRRACLLRTAAMTGPFGSFSFTSEAPRAKVQPPQAVAAARGRLRRCRSSPMLRHRLRRGAWHPAPRRSQRRSTPFFSSLLALADTDRSGARPDHDLRPSAVEGARGLLGAGALGDRDAG